MRTWLLLLLPTTSVCAQSLNYADAQRYYSAADGLSGPNFLVPGDVNNDGKLDAVMSQDPVVGQFACGAANLGRSRLLGGQSRLSASFARLR